MAAAALWVAHLTSPASANDTSRITPIEPATYDKWADIPAQFHLTGHIVDDEDNPIRGARIFTGIGNDERELAKSGKDGAFEIIEILSPSTRLIIKHKMFAPRYVKAGTLFDAEGKDTIVEIIPYTERFDITPAGGTYKSGELTLEVPEGATTEPLTILAAQLPLDLGYNHDGGIEPLRLTSVDLKPHGLKFKKPVTLTMTVGREDLVRITNPVSFYYNETLDRYIRDPEATVEAERHRVALTLSHFSPHSIVDGKLAQSTQILGRSNDLDGDGKLTPSDALFMLLSSGGTHTASGNYARSETGSVMQEVKKTGPASTRPLARDFNFSGANFSVLPFLPRDKARLVAERYSLSQRWERPVAAIVEISTQEYEFDCKMLLGRHEFHRAVSWERIIPSSTELTTIETAWNLAQQDEATNKEAGTYKYFNWQGGGKHVISQTLPGKHYIAVTMGDEGLEVFIERESYIIAKLRDTETGECPNATEPDLWASADKAVKGVRGRKSRQDAMAENFHFGGSETGTQGGLRWGTFSRDHLNVYTDLSCNSEAHQVWNFSVAGDDALANTHIWTTSSPQSASNPGKPVSSVEWWIENESTSHLSEHLTAGLFKETPDGPIPFGFMLYRIDERPCSAMVTSPPARSADPDEPTITGPEPARPSGLASRKD